MQTKATLAGVPEGATWDEAVVIMLQNKDKMNLSADTTNKLVVFEATIPYDEVELNAPKDSEIAGYIKNLPTTDLLGDVNKDGVVNVRDCAAIASALAKGEGDTLPACADFNQDGKTNVRDAASIANMLAQKK